MTLRGVMLLSPPCGDSLSQSTKMMWVPVETQSLSVCKSLSQSREYILPTSVLEYNTLILGFFRHPDFVGDMGFTVKNVGRILKDKKKQAR